MAHHVFTRLHAVVVHFGDESVNYISTLSSSRRYDIAKLAFGDGAVQDPTFYASIHQKSLDDQYETTEKEKFEEQMQKEDLKEPIFDGIEWDLIRAGAMDIDEQTEHSSDHDQTQELCDKIDSMACSLKGMIQSGDPQLLSGVAKFIGRFEKLSAPRLRPKLASAFDQFGWEMGTTTTTQAGQLWHGKRIAVQATAAERRKSVKSRGKGRQVSGRHSKGSLGSQK